MRLRLVAFVRDVLIKIKEPRTDRSSVGSLTLPTYSLCLHKRDCNTNLQNYMNNDII
jgi:hypothetical protein